MYSYFGDTTLDTYPGAEQAFVRVLSVPLPGGVRGGFMVLMRAKNFGRSLLNSAQIDDVHRRAKLPTVCLYERSWALALLEQVRARLREEYAAEGRSDRFEIVEQFLPGEESGLSYVEAARQLGMAEGTLKSDVHRFKQRYRQVLRAEIAHTVARPEDVDEELRHLLAVLGG